MANINNQNPNPSPSLLDPYVKITIGGVNSNDADVFQVGDGKLKRVSVTLGEGKVQSSCRFTVLDPDKKLINKYLAYIESVGGLTPVEAPQDTQQSPSVSSINNPAIDDGSAKGKVIFENVQASTYGEITQGGEIGAYGDKIQWDGNFAAMVDTKYKYAQIRVTNLTNNKSIIVKIVDRGPFAVGSDGRAIRPLREHPTRKIDLVPGAWKALTNGASPGIINVKIEWLEAATVTNNTNNSPVPPKNEIKNTQTKATTSEVANYNSYKIGDFPTPKVGATKKIIVFPGHAADTTGSGGTNGTNGSSPVTYKGESRIKEFVANDISAELIREELAKAGYQVINAPTLPPGRGDSARNTYYDSVKQLKESTGAYALEIHFDTPDGGRSGVISGGKYDASGNSLSVMDVALGRSFGTFSFYHRQSLGGPRRGITLLELDSLNKTLTDLIDNAITTNNFTNLRNALRPYAQKIVAALNTVTSGIAISQDRATSSVNSSKAPQIENTPPAQTKTGAQITIELGYGGKTISATSFIHTGLRYSLFEPNSLEFTGQAASWVLTQRIKNTAYQNITFKKLAQKITSAYGMKLVMPEDGPTYTYFPQKGQTDYEALLIEARRIGYRVYTKGATLYIQPRKGVDPNQQVFILEYGVNMGTYFEVTHQASTDSKGGARSSQPGSNNSTGERKFEIDPDSGQVKQKKKENVVGTGSSLDAAITGSPLPFPAPKTTGETDSSDSQRKANEDRIKGIIANTEFPTTSEALTLDPDTPFKTQGISTTLDRFWVVDTITHDYEGGKFTTKLTCYSPMTNKRATSDITEVKSISNPVVDSNNSFNGTFIIPTKGIFTSGYGMRWGRMHNGIDIANASGTPIYAAASGTVSTASFGYNGGYGNRIIINHGNNQQTTYNHLSQILVNQGQQVTQGQLIGKMGTSGKSTGNHLHWEIIVNGKFINPASKVKLPPLMSSIM